MPTTSVVSITSSHRVIVPVRHGDDRE